MTNVGLPVPGDKEPSVTPGREDCSRGGGGGGVMILTTPLLGHLALTSQIKLQPLMSKHTAQLDACVSI